MKNTLKTMAKIGLSIYQSISFALYGGKALNVNY